SVLLWAMIISVSLEILALVVGATLSTQLIHSGMVKVVVGLNHLVAMLLVSHGFTETMVAIPLLTILSLGSVLILVILMKIFPLAFMRFT
uniref:Uncharacterized protein n=1 Tax=Amphimedon queenslandica TaxID=400682 RepID=A0A1X7UVF3_AMPQE